MGYDMRLYVVEKFNTSHELSPAGNDLGYAQIWGMVELCGVDCEVDVLREYPATDCYIYVDGEVCMEDKYGKPLTEIPIKDVIAILHKGIAVSNGYRRYQMALGLLQGLVLAGVADDLVVLQYGH